jgi:uncharacterized protein (DUF305 family)
MMKLSIALALALVVAGCAKEADTDRSMHDSTSGHMMGDQTMMSQMSDMNRRMVGSLGARDSAYDMRFIDAMTPHHEGAIMMAEDALKNGMHAEIKELAGSIIDAQRREIAQMKQWRQQWYGDSTIDMMHGDTGIGMTAMNRMMVQSLGTEDTSYDARFIDMMIPHHRGAIMMAESAIGKAAHPELRQFAEKIAADQKREIEEMQGWRTSWYGH